MIKVIDAHVHYHIFVKKIPEKCKNFLSNVENTRMSLKNVLCGLVQYISIG
ncbi:hypothetical protein [Acidianus brierleyi]|uniref:hypothetical protein n=1 Tax=Acidianus brierleyi TaxID=41673 RepID=UPI001FE3F5FF|nr:hypothetical protein [Acidianus brierleyi]